MSYFDLDIKLAIKRMLAPNDKQTHRQMQLLALRVGQIKEASFVPNIFRLINAKMQKNSFKSHS